MMEGGVGIPPFILLKVTPSSRGDFLDLRSVLLQDDLVLYNWRPRRQHLHCLMSQPTNFARLSVPTRACCSRIQGSVSINPVHGPWPLSKDKRLNSTERTD